MSAAVVQAKYEELNQIAGDFEANKEQALNQYRILCGKLEEVRQGGAWSGRAADVFFQSMDDDILPAMRRLENALGEAFDTTKTIVQIFREAEEEARAAFTYDDAVAAATSTSGGSQPTQGGSRPFRRPKMRGGSISYQVDQQFGDDIASTDGAPPDEDPTTAADRSDVYESWTDWMNNPNNPEAYNNIHFYTAASMVTQLLGMAEDPGILDFWRTPTLINILSMWDMSDADEDIAAIGENLYTLNENIYSAFYYGDMITANGDIVGPANLPGVFDLIEQGYTVNEDNYLVSPDGVVDTEYGRIEVVDSSLEWDIHMVYTEQREVGLYIRESGVDGPRINWLLNFDDNFGPFEGWVEALTPAFGADISAAQAAAEALGVERLDFENVDHRRAIGIAYVFDQHGLSSEEYVAFIESGGHEGFFNIESDSPYIEADIPQAPYETEGN